MKQKSENSVINDLLGIAIEPTYFDLEHYELNPSKIVKIVKNTGANTIRLGMFSHQGHTYYPSKVAPEAPFLNGRNLLKEFEQECKKQDICLAIYLNSKWVTDLYKEHPDWAVRFREGPFVHEKEGASLIIYPMCPSSPFIRYFKSIVNEVVSISHPDAIYIDNFNIEPFCECPYCVSGFGNRIPDKKDWNHPETQKYIRWFIRESQKIAKDIVSAARSRDSQMPVIFNRGKFWSETGSFSPEDDFEYAHKIANAVHTESAVRFYNQSFEHINEQCVFGRSIDLSVWTWVEYPMLPFSYVSSSKAESKIKAAKVIANGGRPMVWSMPVAPLINQSGMSGVKDVFQLVSKNKEVFNNVILDRFAGLVFSSKSLRVYCQGDKKKGEKYKKTFTGAYELMLRNHLSCDFILDDQVVFNNLKNYKVIILPNVIYLNKYQCNQIKRYVKSGGSVLATYETSLYNRDGTKREDFALKDIFGAKYVKELGEQFKGRSATYSRFTIDHPVNKDGLKKNLFPIGGKYLAVETSDGIANLLKRCRYYCDYPQKETNNPSVIAKSYGKGKAIYIPGEFFSLYNWKGFLEYSQFFKQSIEWFVDGQMPIITDLPDTVEVTMSENRKGQKMIHLINCSVDKTRPIKEIIPVHGKHLRIRTSKNYKNAHDISTNKSVMIRKKNAYLVMSLPVLTGYNVIVLSTK